MDLNLEWSRREPSDMDGKARKSARAGQRVDQLHLARIVGFINVNRKGNGVPQVAVDSVGEALIGADKRLVRPRKFFFVRGKYRFRGIS